jgi:dihydrofolate reductase
MVTTTTCPSTREESMRTIINSTFVSLDGVINHMEKWHFAYVDDESDAIALEQIAAAGAMLMGRYTYEVYAAAWPSMQGPVADLLNRMPKYVVSTSIANPTWEHTTVIADDPIGRIRSMREEAGDPILMHGFGPLAKELLREGLLDELHLWVHPVLAGVGGPDDVLLTAGLNASLTLTGTRPLASGVVLLSYRATSTH